MNKKNLITTIFVVFSSFLFCQEYQPFEIDLGTEPETGKSVTYGMFQINWDAVSASSIKLRSKDSTVTENEINGYDNATAISKDKEFEIILLPYIRKISNPAYSISFGFSYQKIKETYFAGMFDTNGLMLDVGDEGKYFTCDLTRNAVIVAPRFGISAQKQISSPIAFSFSLYSNPFYIVNLKQKMKYHSSQTSPVFNYDGSSNDINLSYPYLYGKTTISFFDAARLVAEADYQRLNLKQLDWTQNGDGLTGYDDIQTLCTCRLGAEIIMGASFGVYYDIRINRSSYSGTTTTYKGWTFSFGAEL